MGMISPLQQASMRPERSMRWQWLASRHRPIFFVGLLAAYLLVLHDSAAWPGTTAHAFVQCLAAAA